MTPPAKAALCVLLSVLGVAVASPFVFAAEAPALANEIDMSVTVGRALNEVTALMDAHKLDEASEAMQRLRALSLQSPLTDYETLILLQTSATLYTARQQYQEAVAEYEAILQLDTLSDAERATTADLAGQLYLQLGAWNKGLEHLLAVNAMQGGSNMETLFRIAFSYHQLGQTAVAIPYMEQALLVGGDRAGEFYYKNMGVLYTTAAEHAKAIQTFEKLLAIAPNSADRETVSADLAALYIKVGNNARAKVTLEALISDFPDSTRLSTYRQSLAALNGARP